MEDDKNEDQPQSEEESVGGRYDAVRKRAERLGGNYIEDYVLGANDGIITTFAVVSGATGGHLDTVVILILGFANLLADAVSMGASTFLAKRTKSDFSRGQEEALMWEVEHRPEEKKEELAAKIGARGVHGKALQELVKTITRYKRALQTALLALGPGLEEVEGEPWKHGFTTLTAFVVAGGVPLIPYVFGVNLQPFLIASVSAAATLFAAGALRTLITGVNWLRSGLEMLAVGSAAGAVAYGVGWLTYLVAGK